MVTVLPHSLAAHSFHWSQGLKRHAATLIQLSEGNTTPPFLPCSTHKGPCKGLTVHLQILQQHSNPVPQYKLTLSCYPFYPSHRLWCCQETYSHTSVLVCSFMLSPPQCSTSLITYCSVRGMRCSCFPSKLTLSFQFPIISTDHSV